MKNLFKQFRILPFVLMAIFMFNGCSNDDSKEDTGLIIPSNSDALSRVLVIPNAVAIDSPELPTSSDATYAPIVSNNMDTNISYSSGSQIILPIDVSSPTGINIKGVYVQVEGASTYFDVSIDSSTSNGTFAIPIYLPDVVGTGDFVLILKFYDHNGNISLEVSVNVNVTQPSICNTTKASGGQGLTSILFELADEPGTIKIDYETYTVKDKIDVFQNGVWLGGTGPQTDRATLRRALNCNVATTELGYVGQSGSFVFIYNPELGQEIEVVVSGCENGGTAWQYTFSCPYNGGNTNIGTGQFTLNGITYNTGCFVDTDCHTEDYCENNVECVILPTGNGNDNLVFYNVPKASSGTFQINDFDWSDVCDLSGVCYINSSNHFTQSGTLTKTGTKSFTFSCVVYVVSNPSQTYTVTGSASYE